MDKKNKQRRQKTPTKDELADVAAPPATPPGASFDTEAGRTAQGMRPDLGGPPDEPPDAVEENDEEKTADREE